MIRNNPFLRSPRAYALAMTEDGVTSSSKIGYHLRDDIGAKPLFCHCKRSEAINMKQYYLYIITNYTNSVLYIGITKDLRRRIYQHKNKVMPGFSSKYNINKLVYFEMGSDIESIILREKQLKSGSRLKKISLITKFNPNWNDLGDMI